MGIDHKKIISLLRRLLIEGKLFADFDLGWPPVHRQPSEARLWSHVRRGRGHEEDHVAVFPERPNWRLEELLWGRKAWRVEQLDSRKSWRNQHWNGLWMNEIWFMINLNKLDYFHKFCAHNFVSYFYSNKYIISPIT